MIGILQKVCMFFAGFIMGWYMPLWAFILTWLLLFTYDLLEEEEEE